jgi:hypothetical protein
VDAITGIVAGAVAALVVAVATALLGRFFGLPGLGREVQTQQAALIATQAARIDELEDRVKSLEGCSEELPRVEARLRRADAEVLNLYRKLGMPAPYRPEDHA